MNTVQNLVEAVLEGESESAVSLAQQAVKEADNLQQVVGELTEGMRIVGERFEKLEIFLPEMMAAADAMVAAMEVIGPALAEKNGAIEEKGVVAMGSPAGDMHEIGKNIVCTVLKADGFKVVDVGRNINSLDFIQKALEARANIIGISTLMTTTMPSAKEIIDLLKDKGLRDKFKVMVGGAPTTEQWAMEIGADGWAENSARALQLANKLMGVK